MQTPIDIDEDSSTIDLLQANIQLDSQEFSAYLNTQQQDMQKLKLENQSLKNYIHYLQHFGQARRPPPVQTEGYIRVSYPASPQIFPDQAKFKETTQLLEPVLGGNNQQDTQNSNLLLPQSQSIQESACQVGGILQREKELQVNQQRIWTYIEDLKSQFLQNQRDCLEKMRNINQQLESIYQYLDQYRQVRESPQFQP